MSTTELQYFHDASTTGTARVVSIGVDEGRDYVVLDRTIFHPAGGGQKSDTGTIGGVAVTRAERRETEVFHFVASTPTFAVNDTVALEVDASARALNSRSHTAGHVLGSVFEQVLACTAVSGQHWFGESFMRFERDQMPTEEELQRCRALLETVIREDRPVTARMEGSMRQVTVDGFPPVPCGGTHVARTSLIGPIEIGNARVKQRRLQVSYRIAPSDAVATASA